MRLRHSTYALITGASMGLGKAFAHELAKKGYNLLLVALPGEGLEVLASDLNRTGLDVKIFEMDLSDMEQVKLLAEKVNTYPLEVLVNNAGIGGSGKFELTEIERIIKIIQLNVLALSLLTRLLLPNLLNRKSYVLNVSSMAAFSPMGYKTVYPASKAFVHNFSRGLYEELRNSSVFVSVVNPGPMATSPEIRDRIRKQGWRGRLGLMSPQKVARISVRQLFKRDTMIMLGWSNGLNWLMLKFIPIWIRLPLLTRAIKKELNQ